MFLTAMLAVVVTLASCESEPGSYEPTNNNPNPTADVVDEPGEDIQSQPEVAVPANLCGGEECNAGEVCWNQQCCTPAEAEFGRQLFLDIPGTWAIPGFTNQVKYESYIYGYHFATFPGSLAGVSDWAILPDGSFYYEQNLDGNGKKTSGQFWYDGTILKVSYQILNADGSKFGKEGVQTRIR